MFVIVVYDIKEKRVAKVLKLCREYFTWVQNSVLEGELTESKLLQLQTRLKKVINEEEDSLLFYTFRTQKYYKREVIGIEKGGETLFL
ncbi:CRISPR-associated endonuclease Cas2 [Defluviitalea raffinosedens]|uniref:CRISPR-associated endonuclease Cas2 n=1 Tax=Defluviitalea raffinosedens TaxID=1450156 RepID=UPI00195DEB6D|nr:CRISPR-associated endonuclease Cas2 [Defluviitalea raffinosedens]MBM7685901.1 CRISPR-associated protein Cas2 [Defluviitalea raffinosedens]